MEFMEKFRQLKTHETSLQDRGNGNQNREFDLNIEKILENWDVYHAIREIIANAIDEQIITKTKHIDIIKQDNVWHITDYGRGLNYHHLTQNESDEKLNNDMLIGRFGVGLKDALATLYRHGIKVKIISKFGVVTLKQSPKNGFNDIITLHASITEPNDPEMIGTDFCLEGCSDEDIANAKKLFLKFSEEEVLEITHYGEVIKKIDDSNGANIYINGVKVAEEPNFLFSYNITSLTKPLKKALNRERTNVGRTAYTDRIKAILTECSSKPVIGALINDMQQYSSGLKHDELSWNGVALYAMQKINSYNSNAMFVTADDLENSPNLVDEMKREGYNPVVISGALASKAEDFNRGATEGNVLNTVQQYAENLQKSFVPEIVKMQDLTEKEKEIFNQLDDILKLIGGKPYNVNSIEIAQKLYEGAYRQSVVGLWSQNEGRILIERGQLQNKKDFAGTLLHECAHAISGASDVSRDFEIKLTDIIGILAEKNIKK